MTACTTVLPAIAFASDKFIEVEKIACLIEAVCQYFVEVGPTLDEWIANTGKGWVRSYNNTSFTMIDWLAGESCYYESWSGLLESGRLRMQLVSTLLLVILVTEWDWLGSVLPFLKFLELVEIKPTRHVSKPVNATAQLSVPEREVWMLDHDYCPFLRFFFYVPPHYTWTNSQLIQICLSKFANIHYGLEWNASAIV